MHVLKLSSALTGIGMAALLAACGVPAPAGQAGNDELAALSARFQARLDQLHEEYGYPEPTVDYRGKEGGFRGATAAFVLADGSSAAFAAGYADYEEQIPMKPDSVTLTASIGKTFFAATAVQLACEEGAFDLDDKIEKWLGEEDWFDRLPNAREITVRMLLNHSAGVPEYVGIERHMDELRDALLAGEDFYPSPEKIVGYTLDMEPENAPGAQGDYSSTHYILLGMVIERVTGTRAYDEIRERFLEPLGLDHTYPAIHKDIPGIVPGYMVEVNRMGFPIKSGTLGHLSWDPTFEWAGGGFAGTTYDVARWGKALYEGNALSAACTQEMIQSTAPPPPDAPEGSRIFGLGVQKWQTDDHGPAYGHGGLIPGYSSRLLYYADHGISVAVSVNSGWGQPTGTFITELAKTLLPERPEQGSLAKSGRH